MEHGGRLPAKCALTVYYLPVYPPYSDYNYGLWLTALSQAPSFHSNSNIYSVYDTLSKEPHVLNGLMSPHIIA
jgi:hypothetical protein